MNYRREDWPTRMVDAIQRHEGRRFRYGRYDCVTFTSNVIKAMTGDNPNPFRYNNRTEAEAILQEREGLEAIVDTLFESKHPKMSQRGDLVMVEEDGGTLGICVGSTVAVAAKVGVTYVPLSSALRAWAV